MTTPLTLSLLADALAQHEAIELRDEAQGRAAVAAIFHQERDSLRLLFIQRATRAGDPWSGHIAFPGGMAEPGEDDVGATAIRETMEEIGIDLSGARRVGRLDDLRGRPIPIIVSALVFALDDEPTFTNGHEVEDVFWVDVETLLDPGRRMNIVRLRDGVERPVPAIRLPERAAHAERPPLWGLTYMLVANLAGIAGRPL
jgi:8-oxo-dGTP pyrophosphatase MutT (NUDIX family)